STGGSPPTNAPGTLSSSTPCPARRSASQKRRHCGPSQLPAPERHQIEVFCAASYTELDDLSGSGSPKPQLLTSAESAIGRYAESDGRSRSVTYTGGRPVRKYPPLWTGRPTASIRSQRAHIRHSVLHFA